MVCVTSAGANMLEFIQNIKERFPKMLHITCFAQNFHRLAEFVRKCFPDVNSLIANTNAALLMASLLFFFKLKEFKTNAKNLFSLISGAL